MLTSVLPGLRELRAPLAAGFTWLAALWVIFSRHIVDATSKDGTLIGRSTSALSELGAGGLIAGASFVAYIVGSTLIPMSRPPVGFAHWVRRQDPHDWLDLPSRDVGPNDREWLNLQLNRLQRLLYPGVKAEKDRHGSVGERVANLLTRAYDKGWTVPAVASSIYTGSPRRDRRIIDDFPDPRVHHDSGGVWGTDVSEKRLHAALIEAIDEESESLAINLEVAQPAVFQRFDRLRGEASLRLGLVLPVASLSVALAFAYERWWLVSALLLPAVMFVQGCRRYFEAEDVIARAIEQNYITSETATGLEELADREPTTEELEGWLSHLPRPEVSNHEPLEPDIQEMVEPPYDPEGDRHAYRADRRVLLTLGLFLGLASISIPIISHDSILSAMALVVAWFGMLSTAYMQALRRFNVPSPSDLGRAADNRFPWRPDWLFLPWATASLTGAIVGLVSPCSHLSTHLLAGLVALGCAIALLFLTVRSIDRVA